MTKLVKELIELTSREDIKRALGLTFVFCDIVNPDAKRIPVRDVRRFQFKNLDRIDGKDPDWTSKAVMGNAKGYEVLTLEGWRVPERVYYEKQTATKQGS